MDAKDHTVSHEPFSIWHCSSCLHRFTQDAPEGAALGRYYKSDAYISHSNTKKGLVNKLYLMIRRITLQSKARLVTRVTGKQQGALLDVGAGTGAFAATLQQQGWQVTGLEPDADARANGAQLHGITLQPIEQLFSLPAASFDAITLWHVLEHVQDLHGYMERFHALLRPGGALLIAVPNYTSHDADIYRKYWAAYDVPRHLHHFSPGSMQRLLEQHGLAVESHRPMWFDSFYISMLSEKYKTGADHLFRAFRNGWASNRRAARDARLCSSVIYLIRKQ